ncbi:alpha/beta hydrolase [Effusibacillus pohliae]|uniref:alpha/beta hydrolase n=1 Tax=Effusibacillus pohliae TaxID=232270 RepID=UPI00037FCE83|nr:alpha/beta hydrolase [Effusibacillus pohliae]
MLQTPEVWEVGSRFRPNRQTELFYRSWIPMQPHLILVMIHGAGQHSGQFLELAAYCFRHDIAFYALDLRGFGQSTGKRGHITCFAEYLDDLERFIEYVQQQHPENPVFLLGHSLGGTIVVRYGQERGQSCVQGAILSAPALRLRLQIPNSLYSVCRLLSGISPEFCVELHRFSKRIAKIPRFRSFFNGKGELSDAADPLSTSQFTVRWFTELLSNGNQALSKAADFRISVLCICGADDPLIDPASVQQFHDSLPIKDKQFILLPGRKHRLLHDQQREMVFAQIVNWLKQRALVTQT